MKWCQAFIQMKDNNAFVRRKAWPQNYFIWYKPEAQVLESWCKDLNLKKVINRFGKFNNDKERFISCEDVFCIYDRFKVKTGFEITRGDRYSEDWEIVEL